MATPPASTSTAGYSGAMAAMSGLQMGASIGGAWAQYQALEAQGRYQAQMMDFNARLATFQGEDALLRGQKDAFAVRRKGKQVRGAQRVALAAQGIEIDSGSALDVQEEADQMARLDAMTIKNNAYREAWGYKVQALDYTSRGQFAQMEARFKGQQTLVAGGLTGLRYGAEAGYYAHKARQGGDGEGRGIRGGNAGQAHDWRDYGRVG